MAKKTRADAEKTRANILAAAIDVFQKQGVAKASLDEIARQANVTRGAIYWHFDNKAAIFQALHDQVQQSVIEIIVDDLGQAPPNPLYQLKDLCIKLLIDLESDSQKRKILEILFLKCDYSGDMQVFLTQQNINKEKNIQLFQRYFERAIAAGELSAEADARILTLSLFYYLTGIVYEHLRDPSLSNLKETAPGLIGQYFKGFPLI